MTIETGFAPVNGTQLYYEIAGSGTPLVMLHAGIADCRMWNTQFETFAQQYRVLRYDLRGYGKSPLPAGDFSHRHDLQALLDYFNFPKAHCMGASYGGRTILDFALEYPDRLLSIITVGSSPGGFSAPNLPIPPQIKAVDAAIEAGDLQLASELEIQMWVDGPNRTPDQTPVAMRELAVAMNFLALQNDVQEIANDQPFMDTFSRLDAIKTPALIIWGDIDRPHIPLAGEYLAAHISGAKKYVMAGTAHLPNMEHPEEFNQVVLNFLHELAH